LLKEIFNTLILEIGQMTYNVYQRWDPLKVCIVGRSYPPEFFKFIKNTQVRTMLERIAKETEEDFQKLIQLLESFDVKVLRPNVGDNVEMHIDSAGKIPRPPITPRDYTIMMEDGFYFLPSLISIKEFEDVVTQWQEVKGVNWPDTITLDEMLNLPSNVKKEIFEIFGTNITAHRRYSLDSNTEQMWKPVLDDVKNAGNSIFTEVPWYLNNFNTATLFQIGKDIYIGNEYYGQDLTLQIKHISEYYPNYRWHSINTGGHADGTYSVVKPGLIISSTDIPGSDYSRLFPGWEVIYVPKENNENNVANMDSFKQLKRKNSGKWYIPGCLDDEFIDYVGNYLGHWVGYVEETVFDVNLLVIDEKNVICGSYNKVIFDAFERHGITPHIINTRHSFFWDAGIHCFTSDIHREGSMNNYFSERD